MTAPIPTPSPLTKLLDADESGLEPTKLTQLPPPAVPRLSPFELELRTRMGVVDTTTLRVEKLVGELQVEQRQLSAATHVRIDILAESVDALVGEVVGMKDKLGELIALIRAGVANGKDHG